MLVPVPQASSRALDDSGVVVLAWPALTLSSKSGVERLVHHDVTRHVLHVCHTCATQTNDPLQLAKGLGSNSLGPKTGRGKNCRKPVRRSPTAGHSRQRDVRSNNLGPKTEGGKNVFIKKSSYQTYIRQPIQSNHWRWNFPHTYPQLFVAIAATAASDREEASIAWRKCLLHCLFHTSVAESPGRDARLLSWSQFRATFLDDYGGTSFSPAWQLLLI